jgi:hypothetical protein
MVMIEAMASGTPVLATLRGSVPEIVCDGVTGFLREEGYALAEAASRLTELDRRACRAHVEACFSVEAMTRAYLRVISAAVHGPRTLRPSRARRVDLVPVADAAVAAAGPLGNGRAPLYPVPGMDAAPDTG